MHPGSRISVIIFGSVVDPGWLKKKPETGCGMSLETIL